MDSSSTVEVAKIVGPLLGGGVAGVLINEWFRRRREKVQRVQLIERVNRVVSAVDGFALARATGPGGALTEVKDVREYQLTLRNSTSTHLQDAEIQFEFPVSDVATIASLPAMSKTPLILKAALTVEGRMRFRWSIPNFPAGDSVEFTFRAVAAPSGVFEVALYSPGVIIERVIGEPPPARKELSTRTVISIFVLTAAFAVAAAFLTQRYTQPNNGEKLTTVSAAGCELEIISLFEIYGQSSDSPWHVKHRVINVGGQTCVIQSPKMDFLLTTPIKPGEVMDRERVLARSPKRRDDVSFSLGVEHSAQETINVSAFVPRN
jgi:hypothetical protein